MNRILYSDAAATVVGALSGTSTVVSYIESSAGVAAGGRSGVTAIVTGLLFAVALFIAPLAGSIPIAATAPALIIVGSMMMTVVTEIAWKDPDIAVPAFLTMIAIPLTFNIANGLAFGFCSWTLLKLARGRFREGVAQFTVERPAEIAGLLDAASRAGLEVADLSLRRPNLESLFLKLTGRELRD